MEYASPEEKKRWESQLAEGKAKTEAEVAQILVQDPPWGPFDWSLLGTLTAIEVQVKPGPYRVGSATRPGLVHLLRGGEIRRYEVDELANRPGGLAKLIERGKSLEHEWLQARAAADATEAEEA